MGRMKDKMIDKMNEPIPKEGEWWLCLIDLYLDEDGGEYANVRSVLLYWNDAWYDSDLTIGEGYMLPYYIPDEVLPICKMTPEKP